ncbi:MAG: hypothetical protein SPF89_10705 [Sphaerochaetaceae bacterium]|nr:hypothetical protein [Spirochaetales bacterium]MDY5500564.1 hypothetical protein [Sphaerochaetaceae bacterium]
MSWFQLSEMKKGISQTDVHEVVFLVTGEVSSAIDVISLGFLGKESILQIREIGMDGIHRQFFLSIAPECVIDALCIGQRPDRGGKQTGYFLQLVSVDDMVSIDDIPQIGLRAQVLQVFVFVFLLLGEERGHAPVGDVFLPSIGRSPAIRRHEFCKGQRPYVDLVSAASEFSHNVGREEFRIAAGDVNVQVFLIKKLCLRKMTLCSDRISNL